MSGGGASDLLDPHRSSSTIDYARVTNLFERLAARDHHWNTVPSLGTEFIPNATGDQMVVKLRSGVTFHDGKPLTAEDVIYTYQSILNPKTGAADNALFQPFIDRMEAVDPLTVRFTFKFPFFDFMDFAADANAGIVPVGFNPQKPIGTGPFKYQSFTPGQQSVFTRNENYWGTGPDGQRLPYVDSLVIIDIPTDASRVNALVTGVVDAIDTVPYALIPSIQSNSSVHLLSSPTASWYPITMRVDRPPFNDVRVRQAFKLICDRPQVITEAYGGRATLGNDLYAIQDPLYDHSIPQRVQDIEQAKSLLKQAGRSGLTVNLVTAPIEAGVVQSCVVYAEQAKAAGVNVVITKLPNTTFYNSQYLYRLFSVDWWSTNTFVANTALSCGPSAPYNDTQWYNAAFNKLYYELVGTNDSARRQEIAAKMQGQLWNESGWIIPGQPGSVDAYSTKVTGFVPDIGGYSLSYWDFKVVSFV